MTPGALLKFTRVPLHDLNHGDGEEDALTTRSLLKILAALRARKRRIEEAIAALERLPDGPTSQVTERDRKGLRLVKE